MIIAATHFCQKWAARWPARCVLECGKSIFELAAIEMQFDCVRMAQGGELVALEADKHVAKRLERTHFK